MYKQSNNPLIDRVTLLFGMGDLGKQPRRTNPTMLCSTQPAMPSASQRCLLSRFIICLFIRTNTRVLGREHASLTGQIQNKPEENIFIFIVPLAVSPLL